MKRSDATNTFRLAAVFLMAAASGCATVPSRNAVPPDLIGHAAIGDWSEIRTVSGIPNPAFQKDLLDSVTNEDETLYPKDPGGFRTYPILVVSGGGANGAYGAGLLKGWSKEGTRPRFKAVTGVSTGALIAPFAFLGSEYDDELERYYTNTSTQDVLSKKSMLSGLFGDSLSSNQPLENHIAEFITPDLLERIAVEHGKGRRLFVGTVNLDAQRFTVWNMGAIAQRGDAALFRKVLLASTAIPVVFPPVHMAVQAQGQEYEEMHVDGGALTQMFGLFKLTEGLEDAAAKAGVDPSKLKVQYYLIRNGYVSPVYKKVENGLPEIANRAFESMINAQGIGDTYRIYELMQRRGHDFNLAYIPDDARPLAKELFDPAAMRELFDRGYQDASGGYHWQKTPPGVEEG